MAFLEAEGVTLQYRTPTRLVTATWRVSCHVEQNDRLVILGPSGCGKSTLLKAIGGFLAPVEGSIRLRGREITEPAPDRVLVFQEFDQLMPWKTVLENVAFALRVGRALGPRDAREKAAHYLEKVKLSDFLNVHPHTLSGGMKQRVAIARGMAMEPEVLLMDEPFAALDSLTREHMQMELLQLWEDSKVTLVFVTHSIAEAVLIGSRILLLSPHPGRVKGEVPVPEGLDEARRAELAAQVHAELFDEEEQKIVA